jgi:GH18 family chitinase
MYLKLGLNSPLYGRNINGQNNTETEHNWKNINFTVNFWINRGCKPNKINLGLAAYGRSFTLKNSTINKVNNFRVFFPFY